MLYLIFMICRVAFAVYNWGIVGPIEGGELFSIIKGSLIFDSASILYINLPFIFFTFLPFRVREQNGYQTFLAWVFIVINSLGLLVNIADIYYFPFKLSRIASDDIHFLGEGNFGALMGSFIKDYWSGVVLWVLVIVALIFTTKAFRYQQIPNRPRLKQPAFFVAQILIIAALGGVSIFAIRGFSASKASYPINMSDASLYVKPKYASLVLSNPFCLIRTLGQKSITYNKYFDDDKLDELYPVEHPPLESTNVSIEGRPNVVFIVMESFGSAQLKSFSDQFQEDSKSYTPFIDSLSKQSYVFTNAFQNGLRSIDAMPAIWGSIPTFKTQFLSLPNSVAKYEALPYCLDSMGYNTLFFHGAVRESMGFVAFGQMAGIEHFFSREDYEAEHGTGDFDGKWGIWDHKFLPFIESKLAKVEQPFMATIFTLSSHHPFLLPPGFEDKFEEGNIPIQRAISYSDYAIGEFFKEASKSEWFNNTLFILTADHGSTADNEKYRQMPYSYAVPLLFYYTGNKLKVENPQSIGISDIYLPNDTTTTVLTDTASIYYPFVGTNNATTQHIDIMPTLLRMLGYNESFFAFGRDAFNDQDAGFAINYYGSAFNYMRDSLRYLFNEHDVVAVYNYKNDYMSKNNLLEGEGENASQLLKSSDVEQMKAFVQQYYKHLKERRYTVNE